MTFFQYVAEIEDRFKRLQPYRKFYGKKTGAIYLEFYQDGDRSITYKMEATEWEKIKSYTNRKL